MVYINKKKIKQAMLNYLAEIMLIIGLIILVTTTFKVSVIAGSYLSSAIFLFFGVFFSITKPNLRR